MIVCGVLVLLGIAAVLRWGVFDVRPPGHEAEPDASPTPGMVASRYLWNLTVGVVSGFGAGILVAGAGGRLAMRLLAVTAGDAAQGRETEADEIVGRITAGGSISFVVFTALFFGLATGGLYVLIRRWLPPGRLGGLAYGALLLVVAAPRIEPLRSDNPDFGLVGPGWLALLVFAVVVVVHGMLVTALAGRYSRALPVPSARPRDLFAYAPLVVLIPAFPILVVVTLVGLIAVGLSRVRGVVAGMRSSRAGVVGSVVLSAVALVALPGFLSAVVDIAGTG